MRAFDLKEMMHGSGVTIPLLCLSDSDQVKFYSMVVPVIDNSGRNEIQACYRSQQNGFPPGIEKYSFRLTLHFPKYSIGSGAKGIFIQRGILQLCAPVTGIIASAEYAGIHPVFSFDFVLNHGGDISQLLGSRSAPHFRNRFSFKHPDDPSVVKEFEYNMPFKDIFTLAGFDLLSRIRSYYFDAAEMKYLPLVVPQKNRALYQDDLARSTFLEKNGTLANDKHNLITNQPFRVNSLMHGDIVISKPNPNPLITNGILINQLAVINFNNKPDLPLNQLHADGLFKDRHHADVAWYQRSMQLALPAQGTAFDTSPYQFLFSVLGTGTTGKPILESEIVITINCSQPAAAQAYKPEKLKVIPMNNLSVTLSVPYTDDNGAKKVSEILCTNVTVNDNSIQAKFQLNNQWTRVAYAAIASSDISGEDLKIKVAYLFNVYTKVNKHNFNIVSLHKMDKIEILRTMPKSFQPEKNVFIASQNSLVGPAGSLNYRGKPAHPFKINNVAAHIMAANVNILPVKIDDKINAVEYKVDSVLKSEELIVSLPCNLYGEFYQEMKNDIMSAVGCREPYKLGEADLRLYTEIKELATDLYKVLRSDQVPNRFVLVPLKYVVSRNPAGSPGEFNPSMILYSTFDVNDPDASHAVLNATLQPDIENFRIAWLTTALQAYTSGEPELLYINDIPCTRNYQWSLPTEIYLSSNAIAVGNLISYSLVSKIEHALTIVNILKSETQGINGVIQYELPDGAKFEAAIHINTHETEGPWLDSPLKINVGAAQIEIVNILGAVVDIASLQSISNGAVVTDNVNISIAPRSSVILPLAGRSAVIPEYVVQKDEGSLSEVHNYIENINCQIIFINTSEKKLEGFSNMKVQYSLADDTQYLSADLAKDSFPLEQMLMIPLTSYLNQRKIRYKLLATRTSDNGAIDTGWYEADLSTGNIIDVNTQINNHFV